MDFQSLAWDVARAGGLTASALLAISVTMGLLLSLGWKSEGWPRFITNELHRHVTLLALVFTGLHTFAVAVDPYMNFSPLEWLVPFASHWRPLWMALGIVAAYLLVAVWFSERLRPLVGYAWWRRFHYAAFAAWGLVTLHGIGAGTDTHNPAAVLLYVAGSAPVLALLGVRLGRAWSGTPAVRANTMGG